MFVALVTAAAIATAAPAPAATSPGDSDVPIPAAIKAMLDAAFDSGNESEVSTIVKYARRADPASGDAVLALANKWRADRAEQRNETIRQAGVFDLWDGRAELGGFRTSGNSDTLGLTAILDATREGLNWRHKFHVQADYNENQGQTTREHYLASYEPNYKIDDRLYIYGSSLYESDRFLGYYDRVSASFGAGYSVLKTGAMKLDVELGPAYRHTYFTNGVRQDSPAGRGTVDFRWRLLPGLTLSQTGSAYAQRYNSTVSGTTAIDAKLIGPLSAKLSYYVQYESQPPPGSVSTDTTTRAALVYSF
jgi:putative salt-induced outer membrane protein